MLALRKCLPIFAVRFDGTRFEGHLAQLVQSARLTRERSLVRVSIAHQPHEAPHASAGFFVGGQSQGQKKPRIELRGFQKLMLQGVRSRKSP